MLKYIDALLLALIIFGGLLLHWIVTPKVHKRKLFNSRRERMDSQLALQKENAKYLTLLHNASDGIHILDTNGNIIEVSDSFCGMLGYRREEMIGMNVSQWDAGLSDSELKFLIRQQFAEHKRSQFVSRHRRRDGSIIDVEISGIPLLLDDKPVLFNSSRDITERRQAEAEILRFKNVLDNTLDMVFMFEPESLRFVYLNQGVVLSMGYSREELLGMMPYQIKPLLPEPKFRQLIAPLLSGEKTSLHFETVHRRKDGTDFPVDILLQLVTDSDGKRLFVAIIRDITERMRVEHELRESEEMGQQLFESSRDALMLLMPPSWRFTRANQAALELFGAASSAEITKLGPWNVSPEQQPDGRPSSEKAQEAIGKAMHEGSNFFEWEHMRLNGERFLADVKLTRMEVGNDIFLQATVRDITEKKESEELIWQQANFDTLTGLPNRRMFYDRLEQEVKKSHRSGLPMALLLLDLDHFKEVNDTLGHVHGDVLLVEAARRIVGCVRESDTVARLGGDEFTVILSEIEDVNSVERITLNIIERLAAPFQLLQEAVFVSASVGITLYPNDAQNIEALIKNADQAMYVAKKSGRNRFSHFTAALQEAAQTRLQLSNDLRGALAGQQFRVFYQPIVTLANGAIHKAEALLRWQHPTRGFISPAEFIPVAEETGMIIDIGDWVFREVASQAARWRASQYAKFQISVNISPVQFRHKGANFKAWLDYLKELGLPGQNIVMEITEGLLLETNTSVTDQLLVFRDAGIRVSLDDFGTGYSSLSYLKKLDIDYLKIDQSFVRNMEEDPDDRALCEAIIVMSHKLGLKVIAEGVETEQQRDLLAAYGCDYAQGWLYSKAVPAEQFEALMQGPAK